MFRFRIYIWTPQGFRTRPEYITADTSRQVRSRIERAAGKRVAARSCVTAICDARPDLHPDLALAAQVVGS